MSDRARLLLSLAAITVAVSAPPAWADPAGPAGPAPPSAVAPAYVIGVGYPSQQCQNWYPEAGLLNDV